MKIKYIIYNGLDKYPPCFSQIRMLKKLNYDIEVIYGNCAPSTLEILKADNIKLTNIKYIKEENIGKLEKMKRIYSFRYNLTKYLKTFDDNALIWFGNAESAIVMKGKLKNKKYIISLLELYDDKDKFRGKLLHGLVENALMVTVCEETRGYLVRHWYNLDYLPTVFPNKAYEQIEDRRHKPSCELTKKIIDTIKDDKVIIYQGIIFKTDELIETAKALKELNKGYKLVLMGMDKENVFQYIKRIYNNTVFFEYVPAPLHLEITSYARIGVLFYRPNKLNNAYCAPNKIYEYSGFGIPIIGNYIPGLNNTIGKAGAGICVKLSKENIKNAILEIENNYDSFSKNAKKFFESCDNLETLKEFMKNIELKMVDKNEKND